MKKTCFILITFLILSTGRASAVIDTILISEVSILAKKSLQERGLSSTMIDTAILHSAISGSLSDLLASHSTVFMKTYGQGALSTISFRGTSATHTRVSWNGIPLNNPMLGQVDFSLIPVHFTDEVNLLHGGSSLHEGKGALGGSIHLRSTPSWTNTHRLKFMQGFGSFSTFRTHAALQFGNKKTRWRMKFFHERSKNDFEYINTENGLWNSESQENADYLKTGVLGEIFYKPDSKNIVSLHGWLQTTERNIPAIMSYDGTGRTETQSDEQLRFSGIWKNYGESYRSEMTLGYLLSGIDYYLANQTGLGLYINFNSASQAQNYIATYKLSIDLGDRMVLKSHLDYNYSRAGINELESTVGYEADRREAGLGLSLHRQAGKNLAMFALLRTEVADRELLPLMPSAGFEIKVPTLRMILLSNITRNYSLPTLNDLYWIPGGNPELSPEEGYTGDLSITHNSREYKQVAYAMTLTGFASAINDWILWRPGEYSYWTAENIARVFARGLEYSVNGIYRPGALSLSLFGTYSYTRTSNRLPVYENDLAVDQQLIYIPIHKANGSLSAAYQSFHVMSSVNYIGRRFTSSSNEETRHTLPGFILFDLRVGKNLHFKKFNTAVQLKMNNLFDTDYKAVLSRPMPGRSWELVFKFEF